MRTVDDLLSMAAYSRDRVNPEMFAYCLSVAILHRPDTKDLPIPNLAEIFPAKYLDSAIFSRAQEAANVVPAGQRVLALNILLNYFSSRKISMTKSHQQFYSCQLKYLWNGQAQLPT